jgi:hypothetical protein
MIKLFSLMYDYYFFLFRGGISLLLYLPLFKVSDSNSFQGLCAPYY